MTKAEERRQDRVSIDRVYLACGATGLCALPAGLRCATVEVYGVRGMEEKRCPNCSSVMYRVANGWVCNVCKHVELIDFEDLLGSNSQLHNVIHVADTTEEWEEQKTVRKMMKFLQ